MHHRCLPTVQGKHCVCVWCVCMCVVCVFVVCCVNVHVCVMCVLSCAPHAGGHVTGVLSSWPTGHAKV